jgi:hypothetical protein
MYKKKRCLNQSTIVGFFKIPRLEKSVYDLNVNVQIDEKEGENSSCRKDGIPTSGSEHGDGTKHAIRTC